MSTFQQICNGYARLVDRNYGKCHVVFDGYENRLSINFCFMANSHLLHFARIIQQLQLEASMT